MALRRVRLRLAKEDEQRAGAVSEEGLPFAFVGQQETSVLPAWAVLPRRRPALIPARAHTLGLSHQA